MRGVVILRRDRGAVTPWEIAIRGWFLFPVALMLTSSLQAVHPLDRTACQKRKSDRPQPPLRDYM